MVDKWKLKRLVVCILSVANSESSSSKLGTLLLQSEIDERNRVEYISMMFRDKNL